jgi:hypothetical protein
MVEDGRVMEWAGAPVKGVVDGLAVDGRGEGGMGEVFCFTKVNFAVGSTCAGEGQKS